MKCFRRWIPALVGAWVFFPGVVAADVFTVINSNSNGPGSLVQAVNDANSVAGPHQIVFDIPGPGVHIIDLNKEGVAVGSSITVDGYTQPGASPNTLTVGNNAVILIQLDGGGPFAKGSGALLMYGNDSVVRGLSFTGFSGPNADYAAISIGSAIPEYGFRNRVEGNFIGLAPDGVTLNGNDYAIYFFGGSDNTIGGNTPAARNLISGNRVGIFAGVNSKIIGNYFGTDASGFRQGYGNDTAIKAGRTIIGTEEPGAGNVFADNGIAIQAFSGESVIRGNLIGLLPDGSPSFGNGIGIYSGGFDTIGGLAPGQGNVIAFNTTGVLAGQTPILSNLFYGNSFIDIDVGSYGRTENDFGDVDQVQNFPVILSVTRSADSTTVTGGLNSKPSTDFTVQLFANGATTTAPQTLLGTEIVMTNNFGDAVFSFSFPIPTSPDQFITATATNPENKTSEFFRPDGRVEPANISTRGYVGTGDEILIGGFIRGNGFARPLLIRALGPSLNVSGALADPKLLVRRMNGEIVAQNDNWETTQEQEIRDSGLAPGHDLEAAVLTSIQGSPFVDNRQFTVQVSGSNGAVGIGTVEIYELGLGDDSTELLNISTRGRVGTGDNVLIGGTIIHGSAPQKLIVRAIGPDLAGAGVPGALQDPTLEVRDAAGTLLASNDDWRSDQEQEIIDSGLAPQDNRDSAILMTLLPTSYTAIVRGKGGTTGIALIELYNLN